MSHLMISRLLKPSIFKTSLRHRNTRLFSSTPTYPFLLIDYLVNNPNSINLHPVLSMYTINEPNGSKQKGISLYEQTLRDEVRDAMISILPYRIFLENTSDDNSLRIVIHHNQEKSDVRAYLPPLPSGSKIQNIAMSSLPKRDKDWVVGVKLTGSRLCFCRPFGDSKWIHVKAMPESINPYSSLMFSKKDKKFYIPSTGGNNICSFDIRFREEEKPKFLDLEIKNFPESSGLGLCSKTNHFVELPNGELLFVQWYSDDTYFSYPYKGMETLMHRTKQFMVFRQEGYWEDHKTMVYTEDIGDFCIFVGHGEAYCVPAGSYPGLKPNCIYFVGYSFGVYDPTTKTCTIFFEEEVYENDKEQIPLRNLEFPYWHPPFPLY